MVTETTLSMSHYTRVSATVSYYQSSSVQVPDRQQDGQSIEDQVNIADAFSAADKLKTAKNEDDLLALLKDGQEATQKVLDKFRALAKGIVEDNKTYDTQYVSDLMLDSVRDAVEGILQDQMEQISDAAENGTVTSTSVSVSVEVSISFEARVMTAVKERDPSFFEELIERLDERRS